MELLWAVGGFVVGFGGAVIMAASGKASIQEECQEHIRHLNERHLRNIAEMEERHKEEMGRRRRRA